MGRPGITYLDVVHAAQQLAARGTNPTIESIRVLLKTGSSSTISQHLRTWKSKQDGIQETVNKEKLPEALVAVMKGLWEKVLEQADAQITAVKESTDKLVLQSEQALSQCQHENQHLKQQYQHVQQELARESEEKQALEQLLDTVQAENTTLHIKCEGFVQQLHEKQVRIDELHRINQQIQLNLEHYRQAALEQRQQDQQQAMHRQQHLEQTLVQLQTELKTQQQESRKQERQSERYRLELEHLRADYDRLLLDDEELQRRWTEQTKALVALEKQHATLTQQVTTLEASHVALLRENKQLSQEKWQLGQENAVLASQLKHIESTL